ncbi:uncharacterized protein LOC118755083 [Rhagoletis pomonella]|uniref:uncharacterized protein LOC118755083 n=1 Tax=Rhagoletis pomonella TaxID=28610 RepID=UPI00177AC0A1|nr:uncharacterized protein LOC118755083 [Rhagoletis pomonella]
MGENCQQHWCSSRHLSGSFFGDGRGGRCARKRVKEKHLAYRRGPLPKGNNDSRIDKVRGLVRPAIDGCYTVYDGDSSLITTQEGIVPIESSFNHADEVPEKEATEKTNHVVAATTTTNHDESDYFTNDRANLKKESSSFVDPKETTFVSRKRNHFRKVQSTGV